MKQIQFVKKEKKKNREINFKKNIIKLYNKYNCFIKFGV